jgi:hypothetical protein
MDPDIFISLSPRGYVYGLFSTAAPLQMRYVGRTEGEPITRLKCHHSPHANPAVRKWIQEEQASGARVGMRVLGRYKIAELPTAEREWIQFWRAYCGLLNSPHGLPPAKRNPSVLRPRRVVPATLTLTRENHAVTLSLTFETLSRPGTILQNGSTHLRAEGT